MNILVRGSLDDEYVLMNGLDENTSGYGGLAVPDADSGAGVGEEDTHCLKCNAIFEEDGVDVEEIDKEDDVFDPEGMDEDDIDVELGLD
ncbi:MAG: hypothetical protein R6U17_02580 [Thermoplasmata archaeon]